MLEYLGFAREIWVILGQSVVAFVRRFTGTEERAEKVLKSAASKKSVKRSISARRTSTLQYGQQNSRGFSVLGSWHNQNERLPLTTSSFLSRNGNCFACGKFGHWRSILSGYVVHLMTDYKLTH